MVIDGIMSVINKYIELGDFLWEIPMLIFLTIVALMYTVGTRGFQFRYFGHSINSTLGQQIRGTAAGTTKKGISSFQALCMALCNTLGVGNIAGVAVSIALGGPGAVFWLWLAGILGLIIKYGEIALGVKYREVDPETGMYRGGLMWYLEKGLGRRFKWLAVFYAATYVVSNLNAPAVQVNTIASSVTTCFTHVPPMLVGVIASGLIGTVLLGGLKRISKVAERIVPFMSVAYMAIVVIILLMNFTKIPYIFELIFKYAVTDAKAAAGGFGGATVSMAARYGFARGFYSNGAGMGDTAFSHASSDVEHPAKQGMWGISEVLIDTIICTCTAFAILITGSWESGESGAALTTQAISRGLKAPVLANLFVMAAVIFFALTTAVMCAYYGEICLRYFTKSKIASNVYRLLICLMAVFSTNPVFVERVDILWRVGDSNVAILIMLSLVVLVLLRKDVYAITRDYESKYLKGKKQ